MTFSAGELRVLHYFVRVADSVLPASHQSRKHLPLLLERVETEISISRERNESPTTPTTQCLIEATGRLMPETTSEGMIGTAEAATIMALTQRRVQQKIRSGELRAEKIGRSYVLNRRDIA